MPAFRDRPSRALYMRDYRRRKREAREAASREAAPVTRAPLADPVGALAAWARETLIVPPGHPLAGEPMALPPFAEDFLRLCCKLGEGAMRDQGASCSPYDSALARRSCSHAMASVRAHGQRSKARSTIRASPTMPPWRANIPAWPLRSARITSKPLIVA